MDADEAAKKIEALDEQTAKVLLVRICNALEYAEVWSDDLEDIQCVINDVLK